MPKNVDHFHFFLTDSDSLFHVEVPKRKSSFEQQLFYEMDALIYGY